MRILAASVFIAGLAIGIGWNGHGTQSLGLYLLAIAGAWCLISFVFMAAWIGLKEYYRARASHREAREILRVVRRTRPAPTTPASPQAVARDYSHSERPGHAEPNQSGPPA